MKKDVKSKGGCQEMAVMVGWWKKFNNDNSGEFDTNTSSPELSLLKIFH